MAGKRRGGAGDRLGRNRVRRRQRPELQLVDPDGPRATAAGGDRQLESRHVLDLAPTLRPPGEADLALLDNHPLPRGGELDVASHRPPDVLARRIDQLELEVIGRSLAPQQERELVVLRQIEGKLLAGYRPAAALEPEVQAQGPTVEAPVGTDLEVHPVRRMGRPAGRLVARVHDDGSGGRRPAEVRGCRRSSRQQQPGPEQNDRRQVRSPHDQPLTLPAMTPRI
jgi:hypothetical protein